MRRDKETTCSSVTTVQQDEDEDDEGEGDENRLFETPEVGVDP